MRLGRNLIAGVGSSAWTALVGLAATPFYLRFLGVEAYGLIGAFAALQAVLSLLDIGLAPTLNRETARALAAARPDDARVLLRSFAAVAWTVAAVLAAGVALATPWLAEDWLRAEALAPDTVVRALVLGGVAIACRWPAAMYLGTVHGAQRLAVAAGIGGAYATVAAGGAVLVLAFVAPTIEAFFAWQAAAALAYTFALRQAAWRTLGGVAGARPAREPLLRTWRFSAGMGLIAVTSVLFTQIDKVLLTRMLPLEDFGRYALATLLASGLYVLATPTFNAVFPRFSALQAAGDTSRLAELYSLGTQALATVVFPTAAVLGYHAEPLLALWTGDAALAGRTAPLLALLIAGTALHTVMYFPYALQLALGRPRITLAINVTMIVLLVPLMIVLTLRHGAIGAAAAWFVLHAFHLLFGTWMTHRQFLRGIGARWLARDVGLPLAATIAAIAVAQAAGAGDATSVVAKAAWFAAIWATPIVAVLASSAALRRAVGDNLGTGLRLRWWSGS